MNQIEIILRTTVASGKVTEQLLTKFDTENPVTESDKALQYSGLCIDPIRHQVSYEGNALPLTETYEFQTLVYLARCYRGTEDDFNLIHQLQPFILYANMLYLIFSLPEC